MHDAELEGIALSSADIQLLGEYVRGNITKSELLDERMRPFQKRKS